MGSGGESGIDCFMDLFLLVNEELGKGEQKFRDVSIYSVKWVNFPSSQ